MAELQLEYVYTQWGLLID